MNILDEKDDETLQENDNKLRTLLDNLPDSLVYQIDSSQDGRDRRFTYVSAGFERLHGISVTEALHSSKTIYDQFIEEDRQMFLERESVALTNMLPFKAIARIRRPSDETRWHFFSSTPRRLPNNHVIWDGLEVDITELKQMETNRLENQRRIHQIVKEESLSRMAGGVAHHYNNFLYVVLGNLELAMEDVSPEDNAIQFLSAAEDGARRAAALSEQILSFSGQSVRYNPEYLDFSKACSAYLVIMQRKIPKYVTLKISLPQPGPIIKAHPKCISQVLNQLITNAWEAAERLPGIIAVTVETIDGNQITKNNRFPIKWEPIAETYACLTVYDNGCGMTEDITHRVFDPFFSRKCIGRGLGLSVILGIVKSLEGCITVQSIPKDGSIFRVYLPVFRNSPI